MTQTPPTILTNPCFPDTNTSIARGNEAGSGGKGINTFSMETLEHYSKAHTLNEIGKN